MAQAKLGAGRDAFKGRFTKVPGAPGDAAVQVRTFAITGGSASRTSVPDADQKFRQYEASTNPRDRIRLLNEIRQYMIDSDSFVPVNRPAFVVA